MDFNQGIDARLITPEVAKLLSSVALSPVRLAFDNDAMERSYRKAVRCLAGVGFSEFTNYLMFNYDDTPYSFYHRMRVNLELSKELGIRVTGFPMRYVPINDVDRRYVSENWQWRYLRGIQCVLSATHGMVSPNSKFFRTAFGNSYEKFLQILSMPDQYIIHRERFKNKGAREWRKLYKQLPAEDREELLGILALLNKSRNRTADMEPHWKFREIIEHYYPSMRPSTGQP